MPIINEHRFTDGNIEFVTTTEPAVEPVTTDELKLFARIDGSAEDDLIDGFIKSARIQTENFLNRALITQTITASLDFWPSVKVNLPRPKLQSVTIVRTLTEDGVATTFDSDNYFVRTTPVRGQIVIKQGGTFPLSEDRTFGGIEIVYVAGYGDASTDIPQTIIEGVKLWAASMYAKRVTIDKPPPEAELMLSPFKVENI